MQEVSIPGGLRRYGIIHPFLVAAFPPIFLFSQNLNTFSLEVIFGPLFKFVALTGVALAVLGFVLHDARKAGVIITCFLFLFISFGHIESYLPQGGVNYEFFLKYIVALAFISVVCIVTRSKHEFVNLTKILNFTAAVLLFIPLSKVVLYSPDVKPNGGEITSLGNQDSTVPPTTINPGDGIQMPHIVHIILDAYGRQDNLQTHYELDNSEFITFLEGQGFYVAKKARTNYSHTVLSMSSTLNLQYLDRLTREAGQTIAGRKLIGQLIKNSKARRFLEEKGYEFVSFMTGYDETEIRDADRYVSPGHMNEFERGLIESTAASSPQSILKKNKERILFTLKNLPKVVTGDKPAFVYAHMLAPHPPFVFDRDGNDVADSRFYKTTKSANDLIHNKTKLGVTRREYKKHYAGQLTHLNRLLKKCVNEMLARSTRPCVIFMQGDHGPGSYLHHFSLGNTYLKDRMGALLALRLPGAGKASLSQAMTPVNAFRIIFNTYFKTNLELLKDRNFYALGVYPFRGADVTEEIGGPADQERLARLDATDYYPAEGYTSNPTMLLVEAVNYHKAGNPAKAIEYYLTFLKKFPDHHEALHNLGVAYNQTGDPKQAVQCLEKAIELKPGYPDAHNNLGAILMNQGKITEAIDHFSTALRFNPDFARARQNLAVALKKLEEGRP